MASESVRVVVRCRPLSERERALSCRPVVSVDSARAQCLIERPGAAEEPAKQFTFDGAYDTSHVTEQIYDEIASPLVEGVTEGYNGTIFAYGQTGSGKSFTMQGVAGVPAQKGIMPRAFEHVFEIIQCAENTKFLVRVSFLEIYKEEIRDLLGKESKQKLRCVSVLKEHPERGVYVRDLSQHAVRGVSECERIMDQGWGNRAVGHTLMNKDSSRSHCVFTLQLEICSTGEYEVKLAELRAEYEAEQECKVKLQEDMTALRTSYESRLSSLEPPPAQADAHTRPQESREERDAAPLDQRGALERLQQLEQEVVGGEQVRNEELRQRGRLRRCQAETRRQQLREALRNQDSDDLLLNVYQSIQEELQARSTHLNATQRKLKAARLEIRDLQVEFEREREDYLSCIRRLEREKLLFVALLERMAPLVRRDCNYSSLDRLRSHALWDEEAEAWKLPDVLLQKTSLPSVPPSAANHTAQHQPNPTSDSPDHPTEDGGDRYREVFERSSSRHVTSSFFRRNRGGETPSADALTGPAPSAEPVPPRPFRLAALDVPLKVKRKKSKSFVPAGGN